MDVIFFMINPTKVWDRARIELTTPRSSLSIRSVLFLRFSKHIEYDKTDYMYRLHLI